MSARTTYYAKVPKLSYEWIEVLAVTEDEVRERHPEALVVTLCPERNESDALDDGPDEPDGPWATGWRHRTETY